MPSVGLDISDDTVRVLELAPSKTGFMVARYESRKFSLGVVEGGQIMDRQKLKDAISVLATDMKLSHANVSLPEEQAYLANLKIPKVDRSEVRGAIELQLEEHVPIAANEAIFDYIIVDNPEVEKKGYMDVVVSVISRGVVDEYMEVFSGTGITPLSFELESQSMARAVVPYGDIGTFMVVDIGKVATAIFVVGKGVVQFAASVEIGGDDITHAIEKQFSVEYAEAERRKMKDGIIGNQGNNGLYQSILPVISELRSRINRHYLYWQSHKEEKFGGDIERVILCGGASNLRGLPEYLAMGLEVGVEVANPWVNVDEFENYIPPIPFRESLAYVTAIGLARGAVGE